MCRFALRWAVRAVPALRVRRRYAHAAMRACAAARRAVPLTCALVTWVQRLRRNLACRGPKMPRPMAREPARRFRRRRPAAEQRTAADPARALRPPPALRDAGARLADRRVADRARARPRRHGHGLRGRPHRFGKRAALKLAHPAILGPKFTPETFLREARIANLVDHPGVTDVFATGSFDGRPYLAMERLPASSLGALSATGSCARPRARRPDRAVRRARAAHAAGVIHGDLKVDNVFVLDGPAPAAGAPSCSTGASRVIAGEDDPLDGLITGT